MVQETPSGKGARDENFPVGSWLISRHLRPSVAAYYAFARAIDDIADNGALPPAEKLRRLDGFGTALASGDGDPGDYAKALGLRQILASHRIDVRHGLDLVDAFRQDCTKFRYATWRELIDYCDRSAAPVGRFLLDLHREDPALYSASDSLCHALQVINHLQDCQDDYRNLNRVYLPTDWLSDAGANIDDLDASTATPALRTVLDRCLDEIDMLLTKAQQLQHRITSHRLATEVSVIVRLARALAHRLRETDPLASRVALSRIDFAGHCAFGILVSMGSLLGKPGRVATAG